MFSVTTITYAAAFNDYRSCLRRLAAKLTTVVNATSRGLTRVTLAKSVSSNSNSACEVNYTLCSKICHADSNSIKIICILLKYSLLAAM